MTGGPMRIGIDIGGTFTDLIAIATGGTIRTHKTASTPADYSLGIETGLRALLDVDAPVSEVLHATTVGSNTILEGKGARTALITTRGFRDVVKIRDLRMPKLCRWRSLSPAACCIGCTFAASSRWCTACGCPRQSAPWRSTGRQDVPADRRRAGAAAGLAALVERTPGG